MAEASSSPVKRRRVAALQRFLSEGLGALVALVAAFVSLFFTLFPDLKPFAAETKSAAIEVRLVERGVTRDQWRWRVAVGRRDVHDRLAADDRAHSPFHTKCAGGGDLGFIVYAATKAEGFKRKQLRVRAALYNAHTGQQAIDHERANRVIAQVPIDAPTVSSVQVIWLYDPGGPPRYYARVEIYDPGDHLLAFDSSIPFRALSEKEEKLGGRCQTA
jgi:hypothetical protein